MRFCLKVAAFEYDEAIRHGVLVAMVYVLADEFNKIGEWHYGTRDDEIELTFLFFSTLLDALDVC